MAKRPRRNHTAAFKAKVALEAVKEERTIIEIAEIYDVHPDQVTKWKKQLQERASDAFEKERAPEDGPSARELNAKIGQLVMENDFFGRCAREASLDERKEMIKPEHPLPLTRQCSLLELSRSTPYHQNLPTARGYACLVAIMDWASRKMLSWRLPCPAWIPAPSLPASPSRFQHPPSSHLPGYKAILIRCPRKSSPL